MKMNKIITLAFAILGVLYSFASIYTFYQDLYYTTYTLKITGIMFCFVCLMLHTTGSKKC